VTSMAAREHALRKGIADRALRMMEEVRAEDGTKTVLDGIEQVRERAGSGTRRRYEIELASAVAAARDPGTAYRLPASSAGSAMALPFSVQEVFDPRGTPRFIVVGNDVVPDGTAVTHWNDLPIERAVALRAAHIGATTAEARRARALATLTFRPARWLASFDEGDVTIRCRPEDRDEELSFGWERIPSRPAPAGGPQPRSIDPLLDAITRAENGKAVCGTYMQSVPGPPVVHLRVATFRVDVDTLIAGVECALGTAPARRAVVLDLRGNPGGSVTAAMQLLELLCGARVKLQVEVRATERTAELIRPFASRWAKAVTRAHEDGRDHAVFKLKSGGRDPQPAAARVVLLVDALCGGAAAVAAQKFGERGLGPIVSAARDPGLFAGLTAIAARERGEDVGDFSVTYGRFKGLKAARPTRVQLPSVSQSASDADKPLSVAAEMAWGSWP
jgi:hypothetical protein